MRAAVFQEKVSDDDKPAARVFWSPSTLRR
jgi:hypothetical protein